jgi:phage terminase large subunit-like protein
METKSDQVPGAEAGEMRPAAVGAKRTAAHAIGPERWAAAEAFYMDGASAAEVSARFGMSVHTIYSRMAGRGKTAQQKEQARAGAEAGARQEASGDAGGSGLSHPGLSLAMLMPVIEAAALWLYRLFGVLHPLFRSVVTAMLDHWAAITGVRVEVQRTRNGGLRVRRHHAEALWAAARRDYEEGDFTAPEIAERYGMSVHAIKRRARVEEWDKTVSEAPAPLHPHPDPAQVEADGGSAWARVAHAAQLPPEGAWATWLFQGGRGAGKTRAGAEWLAARAQATPGGRFALVAATEHDLREVMIEGLSGLRALPGRETPKYESSRRKLKWDNGAVAYGFSAEQPERLRGPQFMAAWVDEFCAWRKPEKVLENLRLGLRIGDDPRLVVTTTPKPIPALRKLIAEASCVVTRAATEANAKNLAGSFLSGLETLYGGTSLAEQELMGVLIDGDGALWTSERLVRCRGPAPREPMERVVVGLDPPAGTGGSACGIVVAGRREGHAYVLADCTVKGLSPLGWARVAAEAARTFGATRIIAEANQGGDMVRTTLATAGVTCAVELVRASKGKRVRAEPVSILYERGLVTHCGVFTALEEQLMAIGGQGDEAAGLDRADALVWALTVLMPPSPGVTPGIMRL